MFTRDVRTVEPTKKGLIVGEDLRVYDEKDGPVVSFLKGTSHKRRKEVTDRLDTQSVTYSLGKDFES